MKTLAWLILAYAVLLLVGGFIGYQKAQSIASLIAGCSSALILSFASIGMFKKSVLAYSLATLATLLLGLFFAYRLSITGSFMPAGLMTLISLATFIMLITKRKSAIYSNQN